MWYWYNKLKKQLEDQPKRISNNLRKLKETFGRSIEVFVFGFALCVFLAYLLSKIFPQWLQTSYWAFCVGLTSLFFALVTFFQYTGTWSKLVKLFEGTYGIYEYIDRATDFYRDPNVDRVVVHVKRWKEYEPLRDALLKSQAKVIILCGHIDIDENFPGIVWRLFAVDEANIERKERGLPLIQIYHLDRKFGYPGFVLTKRESQEREPDLLVANPKAEEEFYAHSFEKHTEYAATHNDMFDDKIQRVLQRADLRILECLERLTRDSLTALKDEIFKKCRISERPRKEQSKPIGSIGKYVNGLEQKKVIEVTNAGIIEYHDKYLFDHPHQLAGLIFSEDEKQNAISNRRLCRMTVEFSRKCNLRCIYCYADAGEPMSEEVSVTQVKELIKQAKELGAKTISLVGGGEPLLYPHYRTIINYIYTQGLDTVLFTNGTKMNWEIADYLYRKRVSVITKLNSFDRKVQDELNGINGDGNSYDVMMRGIDWLIERGFNRCEPTRMAVESIVCKKNLHEITKLWRWLRNRNNFPYIELVKVQGRGRANKDVLGITRDEAKALFEELLEIDRKWYGRSWVPSPPFPAFKCNLYYYNCYVDCQGNVQPCVGVQQYIGNVKNEKLADILAKPHFDIIRNIKTHLTGKCRTCDINGSCYGCRGHVFNTTGDLFESDDMCWRC